MWLFVYLVCGCLFTWYVAVCLPGMWLFVYLVCGCLFTWYVAICLPGMWLFVYLVCGCLFTWYVAVCLPGMWLFVYLVCGCLFTWYVAVCLPGMWMPLCLTLTVWIPISLGTNLMLYVLSSSALMSQRSVTHDGLVTEASMSYGFVPEQDLYINDIFPVCDWKDNWDEAEQINLNNLFHAIWNFYSEKHLFELSKLIYTDLSLAVELLLRGYPDQRPAPLERPYGHNFLNIHIFKISLSLPLMKGHPSWKAFQVQKGWPHKRGSTDKILP